MLITNSTFWRVLQIRLRWVSMAALDTPVVPPVYCNTARSSAGLMGTSEGMGSYLIRLSNEYTSGVGLTGARYLKAITRCKDVSWRIFFTRGYNNSKTMIVVAPESFIWYAISRSTYIGFVCTTIAPNLSKAKKAISH